MPIQLMRIHASISSTTQLHQDLQGLPEYPEARGRSGKGRQRRWAGSRRNFTFFANLPGTLWPSMLNATETTTWQTS